MALLFNDPLAFLPETVNRPPSGSGLRTLVQNWNQSQGTFNHPQQNWIQQQQQLDHLEEIRMRMENLQGPPANLNSVNQDKTAHPRRIDFAQEAQLLEPIPIMDLDHPFNSWMFNTRPEHLGPLATRNNSEWPILPKFTVSALSNGTLVQIPVSELFPFQLLSFYLFRVIRQLYGAMEIPLIQWHIGAEWLHTALDGLGKKKAIEKAVLY